MKSFTQHLIITTLLSYASVSNASGQRTTAITQDSIQKYRTFVISKKKNAHSRFNYIGTYKEKYHILMVTGYSVSEDENGRLGMPWSHVSEYKISTNKIEIKNGWEITDKMIKEGLNIRPSNCPSIYISAKTMTYTLESNAQTRFNCIRN